MPSIGEKLTRERKSRGATIDEIAAASGVGLDYLAALERDDFSSLPGRAFGKLYIRVYAEALGFDPTPLIAEYDESLPRPAVTLAPEVPETRPASPLRQSLRDSLTKAREERRKALHDRKRRDGGPDAATASGGGLPFEAGNRDDAAARSRAATETTPDSDSATPVAGGAGAANALTRDVTEPPDAAPAAGEDATAPIGETSTIERDGVDAAAREQGEALADASDVSAAVVDAVTQPDGDAVADAGDAAAAHADAVDDDGLDAGAVANDEADVHVGGDLRAPDGDDAVMPAPDDPIAGEADEPVAAASSPTDSLGELGHAWAPDDREKPAEASNSAAPSPATAVESADEPAAPALPGRRAALSAGAAVVAIAALALVAWAVLSPADPGGGAAAAADPGGSASSPPGAASPEPPAAAAPAPAVEPGDDDAARSGAEPAPEPSAPAAPSPPLAEEGSAARLSVTDHGVGERVVRHRLVGRAERFAEGSVVAFFTRIEGGRRGDVVRHVWLRGGRRVQDIALPVGGPHWRTHSTKTLWGTGLWAVEARDASGRVLARASFTCEPRNP